MSAAVLESSSAPSKSDMPADLSPNGGQEVRHSNSPVRESSPRLEQSSLLNYASSPEVSALHRVTNMLLKERLAGKDSGPLYGDNEQPLENDNREISHKIVDMTSHSSSDLRAKTNYLMSPLTCASGNSRNSANGLCENGLQDLSPRLSRHPIGFYRNDTVPSETSRVLRGILQGRDGVNCLTDNLSNGNVPVSHVGLLDRSRSPGCRADNNVITRLLYGERHGSLMRNGSYDLMNMDVDSIRSGVGSPGDISSDGSDHEENTTSKPTDQETSENSRDDLVERNHADDSNDENNLTGESTVTSLPNSPGKSGTNAMTPPPLDGRRRKRKQYIPQQHDTNGDDKSLPKTRRLDKDVLQKQLKYMQEQIADMQQKYLELFDVETSEQSELSDYSDVNDNKKQSQDRNLSISRLISKENNDSTKPSSPFQWKPPGLLSASDIFDPSHFIKQASKLVKEQEVFTHKQHTGPGSGDSPANLDSLKNMLKEEISKNVGIVVDKLVARFAEQQKHKEIVKEKPAFPEIREKERAIPTQTTSPKVPRHEVIENNLPPKLTRTKVTDKITHSLFDSPFKPFAEIHRTHLPHLFPPPPYFSPTQLPPHMQAMFPKEPEQTEALPLVVNTPKKKRTKVTDTRLSPRAARALLQEPVCHAPVSGESDKLLVRPPTSQESFHAHLMPGLLPTSVAIPNPSLQHSDVLAMYSHGAAFAERHRPPSHSPNTGEHMSPNMAHTPSEGMTLGMMKADMDNYDYHISEGTTHDGYPMTSTLTPMHLRKAKLMFFYCRYPSSSILKIYFPDVKFNKNNTAQLVKWFSNFREFFYIQMEKYARQATAEGIKNVDDITVTTDSELYRVINLHYNRNNQIEVPDNFRLAVQATLREFFKALHAGKDTEQSWKKAIYKVIARMDDQIPDYFKSPNWMEMLNDA